MDTWCSLNVGSGREAEGKIDAIKKLLWPFMAESSNKLVGIFSDNLPSDDHATTVYFTPATKRLAGTLNAKACDIPSSQQKLNFLGGNGNCPYELFPENVRVWP